MSPAAWSLLALLVTIAASVLTRINVGILALALAWLVGALLLDQKPEALMMAFPGTLFLTLAGVTLLFALAETNGTLSRLTGSLVATAGGSARWLPWSFFLVGGLVSTVGPGAIASVAMVAPLAMTLGRRAGLAPFLTALMVANGANAGALSPISSVGIIANGKMAEAGLTGHELVVWFANFAAHAIVAVAAYLAFRGRGAVNVESADRSIPPTGLDRRQRTTALIIGTWILGVAIFKLPVGLSAFAAAVLVIALEAGDETAAVKAMPWGVILMVTGMSLLMATLEKSGGMDLFTGLIARLANQSTVNGVIALVTGAISTYSSTSGVVLPAFLPAAADLAAKVGGGDPLAIALSINVGSSLVDVSPLSTLGAICVATLSDPAASRLLFRQLLAWGLSMTLAGALLSQLFANLLAAASR